MDAINALPLFLAAADDGNFAGAARRLGLSPSAAGKAIARLEGRLGVPLFRRTTRKVSLTAEGELLYARATLIRDEWREIEALMAAATSEPRGRLRVALPAIGDRLLGPHLAAFAERHPHVTLDLDVDDRIVDLTAGKIDVAIRSGPLEDSTHRSRRLGGFRFVLCAAPRYLEARGAPRSADALSEHALVRFRHPGAERLQPWRLASRRDGACGRTAFVCTSMNGVLAAARAGLGIAQAPDFLVADHVASGDLAIVLDHEATSDSFWLIWPEGGDRAPKLKAFVAFCVGRVLG